MYTDNFEDNLEDIIKSVHWHMQVITYQVHIFFVVCSLL